MRRVLSALVNDQAGVLHRVSSVLNRRQINIESITVGASEQPQKSRMTIVVQVTESGEVEQIVKQLEKQVDVYEVVDLTKAPHLERELALIKVAAPAAVRSEVQAVIAPFRAAVVDVALTSIVVQVAGQADKINACIEVLKPYGILTLARTGATGVARG